MKIMEPVEPDAATRLIAKLRAFVMDDLDEGERALLAMLLAPGVERAYDSDEVSGFGLEQSSGAPLPQALAEALRSANVRVIGLDDSS